MSGDEQGGMVIDLWEAARRVGWRPAGLAPDRAGGPHRAIPPDGLDDATLVALAVDVAGPDRPPALLGRLTDLDPARVVELLAVPPEPRPRPEDHPTEVDRIRARLIDVELTGPITATELPEVQRHLEAMAAGSSLAWARLGRAAAEARDHPRSLHALERAVAIARDEAAPDETRFDLALAAAEAAQLAGQVGAAERHLAVALQVSDLPDRPDALARVLALRPDPGMNVDDAWLGRFDEAWRRIGPSSSVLAVRLLRSQVYATYLADPDRAVALAEQAAGMADALDHAAASEAALDAQRLAAVRADTPRALADPGHRLVALAATTGDREAAAKGYEALIFASLLSGDCTVLDRSLDGYAALADRSTIPRHRLYVAGTHTILALLRGELDRAERLVGETMTLASQTGDSLGLQTAFAQQAMVAIERDQMQAALTIGDHQMERNPLLRWWRLAALVAACRPGREDEVADHLECLLPDRGAVDRWRFVWMGELTVLADAAVLVGDGPRARFLREALAPHSDRFATLATTVGVGSVWRPLAAISALLGDDDRALREFDLAEAANRRIGAVPWLARTRLARAPLLARLGRDDEARDQVAAVAETADRRGLRRLAAEAEAVAERIGGSATVPTVPGLTGRQAELLAAAAAGLTNRQLAEEFTVSIKTVERHLSNIYTALGVAGRAEAIEAAFGGPTGG